MSSRGLIWITSNQCGAKTLPATRCCQPNLHAPISIGNFFGTTWYIHYHFLIFPLSLSFHTPAPISIGNFFRTPWYFHFHFHFYYWELLWDILIFSLSLSISLSLSFSLLGTSLGHPDIFTFTFFSRWSGQMCSSCSSCSSPPPTSLLLPPNRLGDRLRWGVCHDCHVAFDDEVTLADVVGAYCWNFGWGGGHGV